MQGSSGWDYSSPKPQRLKTFSKYQVNRSDVNQSDSDEDDGYKPSINFLKVDRRHLNGGTEMEGLPGIEPSVISREISPGNPQEQFTPTKSSPDTFEWIGTRPLPAQIKYFSLMLIFLMGRTALNPVLVDREASPVLKLVWRNLFVSFSKTV